MCRDVGGLWHRLGMKAEQSGELQFIFGTALLACAVPHDTREYSVLVHRLRNLNFVVSVNEEVRNGGKARTELPVSVLQFGKSAATEY